MQGLYGRRDEGTRDEGGKWSRGGFLGDGCVMGYSISRSEDMYKVIAPLLSYYFTLKHQIRRKPSVPYPFRARNRGIEIEFAVFAALTGLFVMGSVDNLGKYMHSPATQQVHDSRC